MIFEEVSIVFGLFLMIFGEFHLICGGSGLCIPKLNPQKNGQPPSLKDPA
jgi:hypothetical protein